MKILLTGGSGMVGRNLLAHPAFMNRDVLHPTRTDLDLFDPVRLDTFIRKTRPDLIIHCAAKVGGIQANQNRNSTFLAENAQMGMNLILSARKAGVPNLINLASSCMYPRDHETPLREEDLLTGPLEPTNEGYALAKLLCTRLTQFIFMESNMAYKTIIPCNLYGSWDKFDPFNGHLLPSVIRKVHEAKIRNAPFIEVWGDGSARREFLYVEDLIAFLAIAVEHVKTLPPVINVGAGQDNSVVDYYRLACDVLGCQSDFRFDPTRPTGMKRKLMDTSRARAFGWQPRVSLREGISRTYQHFLEHHA